MAPPHINNSLQKEGRLDLARNGLQKGQFSSRREAARVFKVSKDTMKRRDNGIPPQLGSRGQNRLLHPIKEETLIN
jgi:hypothetical protein